MICILSQVASLGIYLNWLLSRLFSGFGPLWGRH